jgi:hypothetical protein
MASKRFQNVYHQIDQSRSPLNYVIKGPSSPEGINELLLELCRDASIELTKARKDHVQAVEVLISCASALHQQGLFCAVRDSRSEAVS